MPGIEVVGVLVRRPRPPEPGAPPAVTAIADLLALRPRVVVEGAGHAAVRDHGAAILEAGADLAITSVGALTDQALLDRLLAAAKASGRRLTVASAGIGALDILAAAAVGGLTRVTMTVAKDPSAWVGTEAEGLVDLARLAGPTVLFDGPVREGARRYPQNVNIAAAVALAGLGLDATRLVILADPTIADHVCAIEAEGAFGRFHFREEIRPTVENPKTGVLVGMAMVKYVRQLASPLVIGG
jgi:aspartate dehydrogenase